MQESHDRPDQEGSARIAAAFTRAFEELRDSIAVASGSERAAQELVGARAAIEELCRRVERELEEDKEQRRVLGEQLGALAGSLERLVDHLQGLSVLMGDLLERLARPEAAPAPAEAAFQPGGEGVSVALTGVPGFQALMDIQKALSTMEQVEGASVERYQEGDSRLLLRLRGPLTASEVAERIRSATHQSVVVEESRPEVSRLRLKIVQGS